MNPPGAAQTWLHRAPGADPIPLLQGTPQMHGIEDTHLCAPGSRVPGGKLGRAPPRVGAVKRFPLNRRRAPGPAPYTRACTHTLTHTGAHTQRHTHALSHARHEQCRIPEGRGGASPDPVGRRVGAGRERAWGKGRLLSSFPTDVNCTALPQAFHPRSCYQVLGACGQWAAQPHRHARFSAHSRRPP